MTQPGYPGVMDGLKPSFRGHSHQAAFFAALGAGLLLVAVAPARTVGPAAVYVASLLGLFGTSALYHRPMWSLQTRALWQRIDHSMIFFLIAGTYTPFCLLGLPPEIGHRLLAIMWGGAVVMAAAKLFGIEVHRGVTAAACVGLGWLAATSLPDAVPLVGLPGVLLLLAGGVVYTAGAVVYWRRFPNPKPEVFGYHEVFHLFVVAASVLHFVAVARLVLQG